MVDGSEWQTVVGRSWAEFYRQTDRSFSGLTPHLLERIAQFPGDNVLDIGCGAGELTLAIARARPHARITGVDIAEGLLYVARERAGERALITFTLADAARWQPEGFHPDLLVSRHGVMFFDDPRAAFAHLHALSAPGANLVFSCFRTPQENPWAADIAAMLPPVPSGPRPDPHAPGPFAFAQTERVRSLLSGAGWNTIEFQPLDYAYIAGMGDDPVSDAAAFFSRIGPAAQAMRQLPEHERGPFQSRLRDWLEAHRSGNLVAFPAAAWLVSAHKG